MSQVTKPQGVAREEVCPKILLVEDRAHVHLGHHPVMFAELAEALCGVGYAVTVLTAQGWAFEKNADPPCFTIRRLGRLSSAARRWGWRLERVPPRRYTRRIAALTRDAVMVIVARRLRRQMGGADVVVTATAINPHLAALFAGDGSWLLYQLGPPPEPRVPGCHPFRPWPVRGAAPSYPLNELARLAEARRRRRGGRARVASNAERYRGQWASSAPWLDPVHVPCIACKVRHSLPDARERLGIDPDARIALLFGAPHTGKDSEVVWRAFRQLPEWQLVIAGGGAAEAYRSWLEQQPDEPNPPLLFDGFADEQTRDLLHASADLVVLSFRPGTESDSGTLVDAVTWGLPVACSDDGFARETVARLGLGPLFKAGDPASLVAAVRAAPRHLPAETVRRARDEMSAQRMAILHLAALGHDAPMGTTGDASAHRQSPAR